MSENYLTLMNDFMIYSDLVNKNLFKFLFSTIILLDSFSASSQQPCDFDTDDDYLNCSKQVHSVNFSDAYFRILDYNKRNAESPSLYYEFPDGSYSISKQDLFSTEESPNHIKVNYRYASGDKPKVINGDADDAMLRRGYNGLNVAKANDEEIANLSKTNKLPTNNERLSMDFSNPKDDLFQINDEHVIIIQIPSCNDACSLEVDLNSNTRREVLQAIELRDYNAENFNQLDGGNIRYECNFNGDGARLIFIEVKTTDITHNELNIDVLNVSAVLNCDGRTYKAMLSLDVSQAGTGEAKDPNAIEVDQNCLTPDQLNGQELIYTVHFENEGNANAVNVYIEVVFPDGVLITNTNPFDTKNFNSAVVSSNKIGLNTYLYTIKNIELIGIGDPSMPLKKETMASFKLKAKTTSSIKGNQFSAFANIVFEGENQIIGISPPIEAVRTNDATTSICAKCFYEKPKEEACDDKKAEKYYGKIQSLYDKYKSRLSKTGN